MLLLFLLIYFIKSAISDQIKLIQKGNSKYIANIREINIFPYINSDLNVNTNECFQLKELEEPKIMEKDSEKLEIISDVPNVEPNVNENLIKYLSQKYGIMEIASLNLAWY